MHDHDITALFEAIQESEQSLLRVLHRLVSSHPLGIPEFELLKLLEQQNLPIFKTITRGSSLELFRTHFILFHLLYKLRDYLRERQDGNLEIHCLRITLSPWHDQKRTTLDHRDLLREYYLDLNNLKSITQSDTDDMINRFWKLLAIDTSRDEALAIFGLNEPVTPIEIKRRYRELVKTHHPDYGGDSVRFCQIMEAAAVLLE